MEIEKYWLKASDIASAEAVVVHWHSDLMKATNKKADNEPFRYNYDEVKCIRLRNAPRGILYRRLL